VKDVVLITGANGHLAERLGIHLKEEFEVRYLTRKKSNKASYFLWDISNKFIDTDALIDCKHIIHLSGYPILNSWTKKNKKLMYDSRVKSAELLLEKCVENKIQPETFICASAIGIYSQDKSQKINENSPKGTDWLAKLATDWEAASTNFKTIGSRVIQMRISLIFSKNAGFLKYTLLSMKYGIAAMIGDHTKKINWIEVNDLARFIKKSIITNNMHGAYNLTSDDQLSQKDLINSIKETLYPICLVITIPISIIKAIIGERSKIMNSNIHLDTTKLKESGFVCKQNNFKQMLNNLK
tara:strand:- start:193 stop:1083 length:891 start_codon:yes stop_codon:yes gene_type:complete